MLDENVVRDVEKQLLLEILSNLDRNKITGEQAQKQAKEFLSLLPFQDQKDLLDKLFKLSQANIEAVGVYLKYAKPIQDAEKEKQLELISMHIKNGEIEHAISVAKGGTKNA